MGTRNLTIVTLNGQVKVAQYGHWDGMPTGQGLTIANFLHDKEFDLESFKSEVSELEWATDADIKLEWVKESPTFSGNTGAEILFLIGYGLVKKVVNNYSYLDDAEYAYDINLDNETVSVYTWDHSEPVTIKFKDFKPSYMNLLEKQLNERE